MTALIPRFLEHFIFSTCRDHENVETEDDRFSHPPPDIAVKIIEHVRSQLFLDSSRTDFVNETAQTVDDLVQGKLKNMNRFRHTLLGRKAVGKTHLLESLQDACRCMRLEDTHGLFCAWMPCSDLTAPSQAIVDALPPSLREDLQRRLSACESECHMEEVVSFLEEKNLFIFGVTDKLENLYRHNDAHLVKNIISEFDFIGDSKHGRLHWILSGSSCDLRALITGKAPRSNDFPSYQQRDLNEMKFQFRTIHPLRSVQDFEIFVGKYCRDDFELTQSSLQSLFLQSGGLPGLICEIAQSKPEQVNPFANMSAYFARARGSWKAVEDPVCAEFVKALARTVNASIHPSRDDCDANFLCTMALWLECVPLNAVVTECAQHVENAHTIDWYSVCVRLADEDILCLLDAEAKVRFASPWEFMQAWSTQMPLTVDELLALTCGNMHCKSDIAVPAVVRLINAACQRSDLTARAFSESLCPIVPL